MRFLVWEKWFAARESATPIVAFTSATGGVVDPQVVRVLDEGGVPLLLGLESAMAALAAVSRRAGFEPRTPPTDWPRPAPALPDTDFDEPAAKELLAA